MNSLSISPINLTPTKLPQSAGAPAAQSGNPNEGLMKDVDQFFARLPGLGDDEDDDANVSAGTAPPQPGPTQNLLAGAGPSAGAGGAPQASPETQAARTDATSTLLKYKDTFGKGLSMDEIQQKANDPSTPPDLKQALTTLVNDPGFAAQADSMTNGKQDQKIAAWDIQKMNDTPEMQAHHTELADSWKADDPPGAKDERMDAITVLQRHRDVFDPAKSADELGKMADDPKTPPDLQRALKTVVADPALSAKLDSADNGKFDGKIGQNDIDKLAQDPEIKAANEKQAANDAENYIPSDDMGKTTQGRPITETDAQKELVAYSDYLPKDMSLDELHKIVDGSSRGGKCPPQLIAAAKYYVDHPDQWKTLNGGDQVHNGKMQDNISEKGLLTADDQSALDRVQSDPSGVFFKDGNLSRDKLQKIFDDPQTAPEDKKAADAFLHHSALFSEADNAKNGREIHGIKKLWLKSDDGQIGRGDIDALYNKHKGEGVAETPPAPAAAPASAANDPKALEGKKATADMLAGELDQPEIKKAKGGVLKNIANAFVKVGSLVMKGVSMVLRKIGDLEIPGLSQLAAVGATGARAAAGGLDIAETAMNGGDVKQALIQAGISAGAALAGSIAPGANAAIKSASTGAQFAVGATGGSKAGDMLDML